MIKPALEALLKSQHFYDKKIQGAMIKNTFDYFFSIFNTLHVQPPPNLYKEYAMWLAWYWEMRKLNMAFFEIPSVAGWRAYYQKPIYYRDG